MILYSLLFRWDFPPWDRCGTEQGGIAAEFLCRGWTRHLAWPTQVICRGLPRNALNATVEKLTLSKKKASKNLSLLDLDSAEAMCEESQRESTERFLTKWTCVPIHLENLSGGVCAHLCRWLLPSTSARIGWPWALGRLVKQQAFQQIQRVIRETAAGKLLALLGARDLGWELDSRWMQRWEMGNEGFFIFRRGRKRMFWAFLSNQWRILFPSSKYPSCVIAWVKAEGWEWAQHWQRRARKLAGTEYY